MTGDQALIQLVPFRRKKPDGVGDYARIAATHLRQMGHQSIFVAPPLRDGDEPADDGFETIHAASRSGKALIEALEQASGATAMPVFLHMSAYGFQKRGVPFGLMRGLRAYHRRYHPPLVTMFHELFAVSGMRHSAFWLGGLQRALAKSALRMSDTAITSTDAYLDHLTAWKRQKSQDILHSPVFSTIGEPRQLPAFADRQKWAVVFGTGGARRALYGTYRLGIEAMVHRLGITHIIDIGGDTDAAPDQIGGAMVERRGFQSAAAISDAMARSRYGLMTYPRDTLGKSTIFAAHAAHGQEIWVWSGQAATARDGLTPGVHYVAPWEDGTVSDGHAVDHAGAILQWYRGHDSQAFAIQLAKRLFPAAQPMVGPCGQPTKMER